LVANRVVGALYSVLSTRAVDALLHLSKLCVEQADSNLDRFVRPCSAAIHAVAKPVAPSRHLLTKKKGRPPRSEAGPSETKRTFVEAARSHSRLMLSVGQAFQPDTNWLTVSVRLEGLSY
jgi:hypothetical protein